jgi:hypothetical protein
MYRSDEDRIATVGVLSMFLCMTVFMFPMFKAYAPEDHHTAITVSCVLYVFLFQSMIGGPTLVHPVNNTIFVVLHNLLFTTALTVIASALVSQMAGIIILIIWVYDNWKVISSVDLEEAKCFRKFIAIICVISLLCNINSTVNYFSNIFYT